METNETAEAMKQIAEIHKVIEGGNKAVFSGPRMMAIGALVVLIPVIEWATGSLTFGVNALRGSVPVVIIVHAVFYWALFALNVVAPLSFLLQSDVESPGAKLNALRLKLCFDFATVCATVMRSSSVFAIPGSETARTADGSESPE